MSATSEEKDESCLSALLCEDGYINFLIKIDSDTEHKMDFKVYEVNSWACDDEHTPIDPDLYLTGVIKWDGCSHVWFGEEEDGKQDGYLHLCGKTCWKRHCEVMMAIYELAEKTIKKYDADTAA